MTVHHNEHMKGDRGSARTKAHDTESSGTMSLPPLAPLPPANIRLSIAPEEWEACLDAWLTLSNLYLRLAPDRLVTIASKEVHLTNFLLGFYHEVAHVQATDGSLSGPKAQALRRSCFKLIEQIAGQNMPPPSLLAWDFLSNFCLVHMRSEAAANIVSRLWRRRDAIPKHDSAERTWQSQKAELIQLLESTSPTTAETRLHQLGPVVRVCPDIGAFFMTGSDFVDALAAAYPKIVDSDSRKPIVSIAYLGLTSLAKTDPPSLSVLSDHLYGLKSQADKRSTATSLLNDLATNTPLVAKLRTMFGGKAADRLSKLLNRLETYHLPSLARPRKHLHRKVAKSKGKQKAVDGELHMHRMSLVTQVEDLFPDLGSAFILRLLDEYDDNVEQVTAQLLDDSLPPHLQSLDRTAEAAIFDTDPQQDIENLAPRSTPPPPSLRPEADSFFTSRRNVFDSEDLSGLELNTARLHIGKQNTKPSKDQANKAAILSALAAFDSDDDERDDTYDVEDVGGTVDTAHPDGEPGSLAKFNAGENDLVLFTAWKSSPELFGRTGEVRRSQARGALKRETGMTDEGIEGWGVMLQRDPRRLRRLEQQARDAGVVGGGKQSALTGTAYREGGGETETEDSDAGGPSQRGGFGGRGRGRDRGRGRGRSVAGPANDAQTATAQRRKEASKGRRANHNRRDQRARKMARGGFAG